MKYPRMRRLHPVLFLVVALPATGHASYVDFTGSASSVPTWTATIDGVTVTATSLVGPLRLDPVFGFRVATQEVGFPGWIPGSSQFGAFTLTFSEEVTIKSLVLFDYDRYRSQACAEKPCPLVVNDQLGSYSVNGDVAVAIATPVPFKVHSGVSNNNGYAYGSYEYAGYAHDDLYDPHKLGDPYKLPVEVGQNGTALAFGYAPLVFNPGVDWAQDYVEYTVRGVEFERAEGTSVPELSASGASSALALIAMASAIMTARRRRTLPRVGVEG
jgi:hypothetical protein